MKAATSHELKFRKLLPAWEGLRKSVPDFGPIRNEREYARMTALMEHLLREVGDDEEHELADFLDIVSTLVHRYEENHHPDPQPVEPREALRFLMEQHGIKQIDLIQEFGTQSIVSEILAGKREINIRQAKALAKRFGVSAVVFI